MSAALQFAEPCLCGHQRVEHASSRSRQLGTVDRGICLHQDCECALYRRAGYLDRDHHDAYRDEQAEADPE